MPIDKMIPRFLVSDEDERLLKEGAMTDALNVTISEDGDGSEGVLKNVKGTTAITGATLGIGDDEVKVIGQVSDSQLGYIYFFVATVGENDHTHDAIYRVDTSASPNTTELVFKNTWLNFNENGFVKADVLNGAFQQDGVIQTILYFTDNENAPRKINVDRAIGGDYAGLSSDRLDYALYAIKAAPTSPPSVRFSTNPNFNINNFRDSTFQFALQYLYVDGEESAVSPYSKLVFNDLLASEGIEDFSLVTGKKYFEDNVCEISLTWSSDASNELNIPDVEKIRILVRNGNDGAFFSVDEINPNENLSTTVMGVSTQVYDKDTCVYKFFNDRITSPVDTTLVNKLYDNVPLYAASQSIASNRLFYSDYKEGRPNHKPNTIIEAVYESERSGTLDFTDESQVTHYYTLGTSIYPRNGLIGFDYDGVFSSQDIPSNSTVDISFDFNPSGSFSRVSPTANNEYAITAFSSSSNGTVSIGFGKMGTNTATPTFNANSGGVMIRKSTTDFRFNVSINTESTLTPLQFAEALKLELEDNPIFWTQEYTLNSDQMPGDVYSSTDPGYSVGDLFNWGDSTDISLTWAFDTASFDTANTTLIIEPRISSISFTKDGVSFSSSAPNQALFINNAQENTSIVTQGEDWHYDYTAFGFTEFFHDVSIDSIAFDFVRTFKTGCSHDIGIVYYDKFNRSGNVNILGSFYSQPFDHPDRETSNGSGVYNNGPTGVKVSFNSDAPDWAERYQLVYAGMNSFTDVFQFTGGGAFYANDTDDKRVYLSLNTLSEYKKRKNAIKDYSFTKGDKLRVISRDTALGAESVNPQNISYVFANDGSIIEFNVLGVKTISDSAEAITFFNPSNHSSNPYLEMQGDFLILEAPSVDASLAVTVGGSETQIKYPGFDWYQITGTPYPNGDNVSAKNYWGQSCLFEILTPRQQTNERVYYEVGQSYLIDDRYKASVPGSPIPGPLADSDHGPDRTYFFGDLLFSPRSCVTPWRDSHTNEHIDASYANWNEVKIDHWRIETKFMESQSISDFKELNYWDKGRPHIVFENAAEVRRLNGITYSDAYAEDVANLSLSSFNPSLANFDSLDGRYGAINYIGNYNDDLVALQENKFCLIPVNKNILEYASGSADVAVSTNVLGQRRYSAGDYGCGNHPEAVLIQDNSVFFVDESRQAVCALTGGQLVPISDKSMSSFFEDFFTNSHTKYVSGYDPRDNTYYLTGLGGTAETVGYDAARGVWQSRYSFTPDIYSNQNNMLFSAKYDEGDNLFWKHDSTTYNEFYGTEYPSQIQMVSKLSPSRVKVFNALSYEGDSALWDVSTNGIETDLGQITDGITEWDEREGSYYASMPRDKSDNSTSQKIFLGSLTDTGDGLTFTSNIRLSRQPIPLGNQTITQPSPGSPVTLNIASVSGNTITFGEDASGTAGDTYLVLDSATNGDSMRGHWMKIKMQNSDTTKHELYCINTHITDSKSHHPLGG
jgi:hypothetical protein